MKHWCSRKKLIILVTLQILLSPWYGDDRQSSTDEFCPSPPLNKWNSPVWILRWVQQVDAAPLMDINVSPTACFAKEGYRHICGLKLAKKIIEEGLQKTASMSYTAWNYACQWKRPVMSVSSLSEEEWTFFFPADSISSPSTAVISGCGLWAEQLVYEATKYVKMESYSVSLILSTDWWRCKMLLPWKLQNTAYLQFSHCNSAVHRHVFKTFIELRNYWGFCVFLINNFK